MVRLPISTIALFKGVGAVMSMYTVHAPWKGRQKAKVGSSVKIYRKFTPFNSTFTSFCDNVSQDEKEP
jgi:hypothetical protein